MPPLTDVQALLDGLDHPRADDIRALCTAVSESCPDLTDEVKWNAPSYRLGDLSIVTLRIKPPPNFHVILHVGSKKQAGSPDLRFPIDGLRHSWADHARCVLYIDTSADIAPVIEAIARWRATLDSHGLA